MLLADLESTHVLRTLQNGLFEVFGGDYPVEELQLHQIAARAAVVFIVGLAIVRIGKSRLIGRVTAIDILLGFVLGSLLSRGITGHASISGTAVASATIVMMHWVLTALAYRSHRIGTLIKGHCTLLVKDGTVDERAMLSSHISRHDLEESLHIKGLETVEQVHLAFKERNGEISIIPRREL
jgi:uncharacterized membrane protein YcaP (DUF421 family)